MSSRRWLRATLSLAALGVLAFTASDAEVLRPRGGPASVRPTLFVDDNKWEALDRTQPLATQNPTLGRARVTDPRDFLLRDKLDGTDGELRDAYARSVEDTMVREFLPAFSKLMRMDLGENVSPMSVLQGVLTTATDQLRRAVPVLERDMALPSGPRHIVYLFGPWDRTPYNEDRANAAWARNERYSPGRLGFSGRFPEPTRDYGAKHWLYDPNDDGYAYSFGRMGNMGNRVRDLAEHSSAIVMESPYEEQPHLVAPYVYPVAFLVHLEVAPNSSHLEIQALLGLQPMLQALNPPNRADAAEIVNAGVPQATGLTPDDSNHEYPLMLVTFRHNLREQLTRLRMHFDFGIWESYHPFNRRITLGKANGAWRLSPYLGGDFIKGRATSYWTHIRVPVRIHMTGFDIVADPRAQTAVMENLETAIELFDRSGGRLIPFPTGIRIGITEGKPTDQASREIQNSVNQMIAQSFADARTKTRAQALQKFPLAALFIDK